MGQIAWDITSCQAQWLWRSLRMGVAWSEATKWPRQSPQGWQSLHLEITPRRGPEYLITMTRASLLCPQKAWEKGLLNLLILRKVTSWGAISRPLQSVRPCLRVVCPPLACSEDVHTAAKTHSLLWLVLKTNIPLSSRGYSDSFVLCSLLGCDQGGHKMSLSRFKRCLGLCSLLKLSSSTL